MFKRFGTAAALLCSLLAPLASQAQAPAQTWPDKPVKLVLSQPPGSGPDNVARLLSERLGKQWGQAVVIENKPGGQNVIGAQTAARAPADGQTFYFATTAALVTNAYLFKSLPYDPQKDFVPVAFVARSPFAVRGARRFADQDAGRPGRPLQGRPRQAEPRQRRPAHLRRHDRAADQPPHRRRCQPRVVCRRPASRRRT